jgi:hypothetical protein
MTMTVAQLSSIEEIRQLAFRYAHAHDFRDMELMEDLFADATEPLEYPSFNVVNARQIFPVYWKFAGPAFLLVSNHIVDVASETDATGTVRCLAKLDVGGTWIEQAILYQDRYRHERGAWRFVDRRHLLWYGVELAERPLDQEPTQWPTSPVGRGSVPEDIPSWREFYGIAEAPGGFYSQPPAEFYDQSPVGS